jgi:hypothetical protein
MSRQSLLKSALSSSVRHILTSAVSPLFEGLEKRSHLSVTPTAVAGGPYTVAEGQSVLISGLASTDSDGTVARYEWDTNYNVSKGFKARATTGTWKFHADTSGTRTIALRVVDNDNDVSTIQTAVINITDVAPTLTLTAPNSVDEGKPVNISWSYSDVGRNDAVTAWDVDWGDGTTATFVGSISDASHTYAEDGSFDIVLTATQAERQTPVTHTITVVNDGPSVVATTPNNAIDEGEMVQLDFSTLNRVGTLDSWTIDWGDGLTDVLEPNRSHAVHFYTDSGNYAATIRAQEPDGGYGEAIVNFAVGNVAPEITQTAVPATGTEGSAITLGSTKTDAGQDDTHTYGWTVYRNGQLFTLPNGTDLSGTSFTFTPTDNGSYVARLTVTDDEGAQATVNSAPIVVGNVAPTATISGTPGTITEGDAVNLTVAPVDAGSEDAFTYAWSVTKGNVAYTLPTNTATNTANFVFTPRDNGSYIATVVVTDDDTGSVSVSTTAITVNNAIPAATIDNAPTTADENAAINVSAGVTDAGEDDTHAYQWSVENFHDGKGIRFDAGDPGTIDLTSIAGTDVTVGTWFKLDANPPAEQELLSGYAGGNEQWSIKVVNGTQIVMTVGGATINSTEPVQAGEWNHVSVQVWGNSRYFARLTVNGLNQGYTADNTLTSRGDTVFVGGHDANTATSGAFDGVRVYQYYLNGPEAAALYTNTLPGNIPVLNAYDFDSLISGGATDSGVRNTPMLFTGGAQVAGQDQVTAPLVLPNDAVTDAQTFTWTPRDNGTYRLKLTVTDKDGAPVSTQTSTITINNVAPQGTISGETTADEGGALNFNVDVVDAADDTQAYVWSVKKDNVSYTLPGGTVTNTAAFAFAPVDDGSYEVSVLITDKDGASSTATHTISVANVDPTTTITSVPATGVEGSAITVGSTAADVGTDDTLTYAWSVLKNNAAYALPGGTTVDASGFTFTPVDNGTYKIRLTVTDGDGGSKTVTTDGIVVANALPTAVVSGEPGGPIVEGAAVNLTVAPSDAGLDDTHTYLWSIKKDGATYNAGNSVNLTTASLSFTARDNGVYVATVVVTDNDGGEVSVNSADITVTNATPTAVISAPTTGTEGSTLQAGSTVTDAGALDTHTYQWSVEKQAIDGVTWSPVSLPGSVATTGTSLDFKPVDDGTYRVQLVVTDKDGAPVSVTSSDIVVANVNPDGSIAGPATRNEGSAVALTATATDAGSLDTLTYAWSVTKDGSAVTLPGSVVIDTASFAYTPADQGAYVFTCLVTDKDGGTKTLTHNVAVSNVSPTLALVSVPTTGNEGSSITVGSTASDPGDDTLTYGWTVYRNGQLYSLPNGTTTDGTSLTFTPTDNGSYVVRLSVTDEDTGITTRQSNAIGVAGVAPAVTIDGATTGTEGEAVSLASTASDVSSNDEAAGFTYAWTAKRGNVTVAEGNTASFDFTPNVHGTYAVTLVVTDKDNTATTTTSQVSVANLTPTNMAIEGSLEDVVEGATVNLTASADDVSGDVLSYAWKVMKGESVFANGTGQDIAFTAARGDYQIVVTATDTAGASDSTTSDFSVANIAPTGTMVAPTDTVLINSAAAFTLTGNDAQLNQALSVVWDFGDGTGTAHKMTAGQDMTRKHSYASRGTYTIMATISDGVSETVVTKTIFVAEAAMISDPSAPAKQALIVVGSEANDTIDVAQQTNGRYAVTFNGANLGTTFAPTSRIYVYGYGGANNITVSGKTDAVVFAGSQGGNVTTGAGNDVIVGSVAVDRLNGGTGRDILIGAPGADILRGGDGEDLLVAGSLVKMNDTSSVVTMMSTWGDSSLTLTARKNNLTALFSKQLVNDQGNNQLYGEAGNDWMVINSSSDRLRDLQSTDLVN